MNYILKLIFFLVLSVSLKANIYVEDAILLMNNDELVRVTLPAVPIEEREAEGKINHVKYLLQTLVTPDNFENLHSLFPKNTSLTITREENSSLTATAALPRQTWPQQSEQVESRLSWLLNEWTQNYPVISQITLIINSSDGQKIAGIKNTPPPMLSKPEFEPESELEAQILPPPVAMRAGGLPSQASSQPTGALSDASIFLNPGHGWYYEPNLGRWATQRGNTYGVIEDLNSGETVFQYLHQYLWNAGARIYTARERDLNPNMVIVNQGGSGYSQTGSWTTQNASGAYNGAMRVADTVTSTPTAKATFTPNIPEDGYYAVYVWYRRSTDGITTADARITINHTGDSTTWIQNQDRDGYTWKYIGTYFFEKGSNSSKGSVVIDNKSTTAGRKVIAGAVRFGGGMGSIKDPASNTTSNKPRWEESGRYHAGFLGKTDWANYGRVDAMPRWAAWEHETWENNKSVYLAIHTNAAGGTGTETYSHITPVAKSNELRNLLQNQIVNDIRLEWKSNWADRGKKTANFGELNTNNNNKMPAALIETAFHDRAEDAKFLLDPQFRRDISRAIYRALVRFYATQMPGFSNNTYLPEPPTKPRATILSNGSVQLHWSAPPYSTGLNGPHGHQATGYKVYKSSNGFGFDNGTAVSSTSLNLSQFSPGDVVYFKIAATNAGGESFPTSTLAVRIPENSMAKQVLIVDAFDRNDRFMNLMTTDPHSSNVLPRGYTEKLNTGNYIIPHIKAINAYEHPIAVSSTTAEVIQADSTIINDYDAVIWMSGLQADKNDIGGETTPTLTSTLRSRIGNYLSLGGNFFISGARIAWDANREGENNWLQNNLRASFSGTNTSSLSLSGASGSVFAGWNADFLSTFDGYGYELTEADAITPKNSSAIAASYSASSQVIDAFDAITGWWQPNQAGQTNADVSSSFSIVSSPKRQGSGAAKLNYIWGSGNFIREYKSPTSRTKFSKDSNLSIWVYGDNSGHRLRFSLYDSDGEFFASPYTTINFSGWKEITWNNIASNATRWAGSGDNKVTGPMVDLDSIHLSRTTSGTASGNIYFDNLTAAPDSPSGQQTAAIQYDGDHRLIYLALPFETIEEESKRNSFMARTLDFFQLAPTPWEEWLTDHFTPAQLEDPQVSGELANPSKDGIPNLLKYAMGLDPFTPSPEGMPTATVNNGQFEFAYQASTETPDIELTLELSSDLKTWTDASTATELIQTTTAGNIKKHRIRLIPPGSQSPRKFLRLRAERITE